jgi:hypothetical protein
VNAASTPEPYVGTRPFDREDSENFFGRDREASDLFSLVLAVPVVLIYAASGAGKSSLLNAGLIPRLEKEGFQVLGPARVTGPVPPEIREITNVYRFHTLCKLNADLSSPIATASELASLSLQEFLGRLDEQEPDRPRALLLDQFEKFFAVNIAPSEQRRAFIEELAQASRAPSRLKVVFAMREEYIAQFEVFAYSLPDKLRTRMRLEPLRERAAVEAIRGPLERIGLFFEKGEKDSDNPAEALVRELLKIHVDASRDEGREIIGEFVEPIQLQVVCQNMWQNFPDELKAYAAEPQGLPRERKIITRDQIRIGDVDHALAQHYDRAIENAVRAFGASEGQLRRWFDSSLITGAGGRGIALDCSDETKQLSKTALEVFLDQRLVRKESRGGSVWYELTHDRFIEPIQRSNRAWFEQRAVSEALRSKLEAKAQIPGAFLDESETRDAEAFLASTDAGVLGTSPEVVRLVKASRQHVDKENARKVRELQDAHKLAESERARAEDAQLLAAKEKQLAEEAKRRQAEELEELRRRAREEERLHKAESERVKLLLEKRKRERIFSATVFLLGVVLLIAIGLFINQKRKEYKADKERLQKLIQTAQIFRDKAKADLRDETNPIQHVTALRNLSVALGLNRQDTEATRLARDLLLQHVWCPPAAPEMRYRQDALLAGTFAPGGSNDEVFAVAGNGQLLRWKGSDPSPVRSLFEKPKTANPQQVVQPGFASFSPDGQWLLIIPPTLVSAAIAEAAAQGAPQQRAAPAQASTGHEPCKVQAWRWTAQNRTYEQRSDLEIQRLPGSWTNFTWSADSDCVALINWQSGANAECELFKVDANSVQEIPFRPTQLNGMKIVAIAFSPDRSRIAAVSSERKVMLIGRNDLQVIPNALNGKDWIQFPEGFQPNGVAFGPGDDELTLMSWRGIRILNTRNGNIVLFPSTFRDQGMRMVVGPGDSGMRLVATSLNGRVHVAKGARWQEPAEPVVFRGSLGIPQFSSDGQRLLILSGGTWNAFDSMRLIDVSPVYRPQEAAPQNFEEKPAPPWLVEIAGAVSALDVGNDGSLNTLEAVRKKYPESKAGDAYESVWKRFFPGEKSNGRLETGRR